MPLYDLPDFEELLQETRETMRDLRTALGTAPDTGPGSDVDIDSTTIATSEHRLHRYQRLGVSMLHPQSASGEGTIGWAKEMGLSDGQGGYGPVLPDVSSAADGLSCSSTSGGGTADLQNLTLLDTAGKQYKVNESVSIPGADTTIAVDIISIDTGLVVNLPVGSVLTFESPITNLEEEATIAVELEGGVNAAEDPETNDRVLDRWRAPSLSGNNVQWRRWIEETDEGVFDGWVWPTRFGSGGILGTVDYGTTLRGFSRAGRIISAAQVAAITAHVNIEAPIDLMNNARHVTLTAQLIANEIEIELHPGADSSSSPDFDSHTLDASVDTWTVVGDGGWIRADKQIDAVIEAGDYVIINSARALVTNVGAASAGGANTDFDVDVSFLTKDAEVNPYPWPAGYDPTATPDNITSGGGVIEASHVASIGYLDGLGPARGLYPASDFTGWDDTYRHKLIQSAAQRAATDILDTTVLALGGGAAVDVTPTDPLGATNVLLIAGQLVIQVVP